MHLATQDRSDGRAIVAVDRPIALTVDSVTLDNVALGRRATADLVSRGYRRIACITGPTTARTAVDRADGWRKEMRRHKLPVGGLLRRGNARVDGGRTAAEELMALPEPPEAIVSANSLIAVGVLQVLDELGDRSIGFKVIGDLPFATSYSTDPTALQGVDRGREPDAPGGHVPGQSGDDPGLAAHTRLDLLERVRGRQGQSSPTES